ncbi:MAG: exodeoxyribonuclease III [Candidatus Heimdallarchaeota archaeon]|nr:exodeoxyribonuclease III [Candidatus Heimdallarchaeota archaeon]
MKELTMFSWNVNGIRALIKKEIYRGRDFFNWLKEESPDILCFQETKSQEEQIKDELLNPLDYRGYWRSAERKGYSGVVTFAKEEPLNVEYGLGIANLDKEGRFVALEFEKFILCNVYFPNGKKDQERLKYKMDYYDAFLEYCERKRSNGKSVIFCGDVNTAHKPIDLTHPKANENISGFLPIEREWMDKIVSMGYIDTFRFKHGAIPEKYSWWSVRNIGAREKNVGWRLDYFFVTEDLKEKIIEADILTDVMGSDHCPVSLKLKI